MITQMKLADDTRGLSSLVKPRSQVAFQGFDVVGSVRVVTDDRTAQDGAFDQTQYAGVAVVTLTLKLTDQFRALLDEFSQFCVPWARPYLQVTDSEWAVDRKLNLRYDSTHAPIGLNTGLTRVVQYAWTVPNGVWEEALGSEYLIPASAPPTDGLHVTATNGVSVNATTGVTIKASNTSADTLVNVGGNMPVPWKAKLYGPCSDPALYDDTTGQALIFTGLTLTAGQYLDLDSAARSALLNSDPASSRLLYLNYASSAWFQLKPGTNLVRFAPGSVSAGSSCDLTFTNRWMP